MSRVVLQIKTWIETIIWLIAAPLVGVLTQFTSNRLGVDAETLVLPVGLFAAAIGLLLRLRRRMRTLRAALIAVVFSILSTYTYFLVIVILVDPCC